MLRICLLMIERMNKPATRTWTPRRGISINIHTSAPEDFEAKKQQLKESLNAGAKKQMQIEELSAILDRTATEEDNELLQEEQTGNTARLAEEQEVSITSSRPVNPDRIKVSDNRQAPTKNVQHGTVSLIRDVSPPSAHE